MKKMYITCFFTILGFFVNTIPVLALDSVDITNVRVTNINEDSAKILFKVPKQLRAECKKNGFYYDVELSNTPLPEAGQKRFVQTTRLRKPFFALKDLQKNSDYAYTLRLSRWNIDNKKHCSKTRAQMVNKAKLSNPVFGAAQSVSFTTNGEIVTQGIPTKTPISSDLFVNKKYPYVSVELSHQIFDENGNTVGSPSVVQFEYNAYDRFNNFWYNVADQKMSEASDEFSNTSYILLGFNPDIDEVKLNFQWNHPVKIIQNYDQDGSVVRGAEESQNYEISEYTAVVLHKKDQTILIYDQKTNTYHLFYVRPYEKETLVPPTHNLFYSSKTFHPVLLWADFVYDFDFIKSFNLEYTCVDCADELSKKTISAVVTRNALIPPSSTGSSMWQHLYLTDPEKKLLNKSISYRIQTNFITGVSSPWSVWRTVQMVEDPSK
jgi:hypothetical protein